MPEIDRIDSLLNLQKIQSEINTVEASLSGLANQMKQVATATASVNSGGGSQSMKKTVDTLKQLDEATAKLNTTYTEQEKELIRLKELQKQRDKAIKDEIKASIQVRTEWQKLNDSLNGLKKQYRELAAQNKENTAEGRKLLANITEMDKRVKQVDASVGNHQRNVGNYSSAFKGLTSTFMGLLPVAGGVAGAIALTKEAIASTDASADAFEQTMSGLREGFRSVMRAFATGDFSNLISGFQAAAKAGREYTEAMQIIEDKTRGLSIREKILEEQMLKQEMIFRDRTRSLQERSAAEQKYRDLSNQKMREAVSLAREELNVELTKASKLSGISKENLKSIIENQRLNAQSFDDWQKRGEIIRNLQAVEPEYWNSVTERMEDNTAAYNDAQAKLKTYTELEKNQASLGMRYNIITGETRDRLTELVNKVQDLTNSELERQVSLLRVSASIEKGLQAETKLAAVHKEDTDVLEYRKAVVENLTTASAEYLKNQEKIKKELEATWEAASKFEDVVLPWEKDSDDLVKFWANVKASEEELKKLGEELKDLGIDTGGALLNGLIGSDADDRITALNESLQNWHDLQITNLEDRKNKGIISEKEYNSEREKIEKQYAQKQKEARRREAQIRKDEALWEIAINTAVAVAKASPNLLLMALAGATGIAQAAIVAAKPLPKYAKGRDGGAGEMAIVGEQGKEVIQLPSGEQYVTPDRATVTYLPAGAKVIPNITTFGGMQPLTGNNTQVPDFGEYFTELKNTIKGLPINTLHVTEKGFYTTVKKGLNVEIHLSNNVRL